MMNLNKFMKNGISGIMGTLGRYYIASSKGRAFLAGMLPRIKKSAALREAHEAEGTHIPPFLIASIASQCNLHCAGCYARAGGACSGSATQDMSAAEWGRVFGEAAGLGVSFVLLAGGEPLMRRDIIEQAARRPDIIFPIFTNGTMIDDGFLALLDAHRNLVPVLSIEGDAAHTDARRGEGAHAVVEGVMEKLKSRGILYGASITLTRDNLSRAASEDFVASLQKKGCGIVFFVEYVPIERGTEHLVLEAADLDFLQGQSERLKKRFSSMVILTFPGDEAAMGGCLASGRGFFHINPAGGAEPCPFSPHARHSLRETPMLEILRSGYFAGTRKIAADAGEHKGGCVLFEREAEVLALVSG